MIVAADSSSLVEHLRDGFSVAVAETGGVVDVAAVCPTLVLACPMGRDGASGPPLTASLSVIRRERFGAHPGGGAVYIVIDLSLLHTILADDYAALPDSLTHAIGSDGVTSRPLELQRTAELTLAAHAVRRCPHAGAIRSIFLKSKALEMLAMAFGDLKAHDSGCEGVGLPPRDIERMVRIRDTLLQRLEVPPRLEELAAEAGMCETRLKQGFKRLFGDTPAALSKRARMAKARELLVRRHCRVGEAAMAVGYTNVSHFIDAFVREYGVRPGHLARLVRRGGDAAVA